MFCSYSRVTGYTVLTQMFLNSQQRMTSRYLYYIHNALFTASRPILLKVTEDIRDTQQYRSDNNTTSER